MDRAGQNGGTLLQLGHKIGDRQPVSGAGLGQTILVNRCGKNMRCGFCALVLRHKTDRSNGCGQGGLDAAEPV